jgi:hypothetical protein
MERKFLLASCFFPVLSYAAAEDGNLIPEGKLIDYPNIYHDVTPSAGPRVINGIGMFATGDYLYWVAKQDNMQYASTGYTNDNFISTAPGSASNLKFRFHSGFKAGLGFSFGHDYWDLSSTYTWFLSDNNTGSVKGGEYSGLTPSFDPYIDLSYADYFTKASSLWTLHFNVIDVDLGRNFYISKYLSLRPFIGLKGSWQKQKSSSSYLGMMIDTPFSYSRNLKSSFWGIGIHTGCNTAWHLAGTWSIYGDIAFSSLWGPFQTKRTDKSSSSGSDVTPVSQTNNFHTLSPVLELALGLRKEQWFYHNRFHVAVQAGWEEQIWWDQNQFAWNRSISLNGNLILQGLTARIRFDF